MNYEKPTLTYLGNVRTDPAFARQLALDVMNAHFKIHEGCADSGRSEMCEEGDRLYAEFLRADRAWLEAGKPDLF